ncbi:hypothetical protein PILCRDRAFT_814151 [Piloderma croceum F 1598]|uniref:Uncharacterized protein n=1 Tax=Piloderma croceum (strain F 1598) TaxID=765440 RepID=A0A0C3GC75_PILCF|nr:hypothetical protein PILCRDRAFT_814151 [Piloderma croceum F 1598]
MPKSCLKIPTPPMTPGGDCSHPRKCVAFSAEDLERIYIADEWDRTPTEVAQKLSYGDVLELKAIQRSLPTAAQLPDPLARRPQSQFLKGVPIALLPLYDDNLPCNSVSKPPPTSTVELPPVPSRSPHHAPAIPSSLSSTPITASPTWSRPLTEPTRSYPPRSKPNFAFLPLLDAPTPSPQPPPPPPSSEVDTDDSDHDLSTPALSSASLDTTPSPRDYSDSESYFQLPTRREAPASRPYFASCPPAQKSASTPNPAAHTPSPFSLNPPNSSVYFRGGPKKPLQVRTEPPICFDINGETYHFGPASTPPGSPPLSPLSPTLHSPGSSSPPQKYPPFFSDRGQDLQPSFSRSSARNQGSPKTPTRTKDFRSSSPILGPYCTGMKRGGGGGSPCSSPVLSPVRGGTTSRKGRLEH